jgi:predicted O-methyltransferase YrrM
MDTIFIVLLVIVLITFALVYTMCAYKMNTTKGGNDKLETNEINPIISKIYKTKQVELLDGKTIPLRANVHDKEGLLIYTLVKKHKLTRCMEIGFAMGLSALHICQAFADLSDKMDKSDKMELISIDPFQDKNWKCAGIANIKNAGFEKYHTWIKDKSYSAMPKFLTKQPFDFIFIDGWHTFDYTLVDMFYADRLLRIGGYLLIDDALHQGPSKAIAYSNKNYKHWKRITFDSVDVPKTQVLYQKIAEDTKDWDYHVDF